MSAAYCLRDGWSRRAARAWQVRRAALPRTSRFYRRHLHQRKRDIAGVSDERRERAHQIQELRRQEGHGGRRAVFDAVDAEQASDQARVRRRQFEDRPVIGDMAELFCQSDGLAQTAYFIDELSLERLFAGPYATLTDRVHVGLAQLATARHTRQEHVVELRDLVLELSALFR